LSFSSVASVDINIQCMLRSKYKVESFFAEAFLELFFCERRFFFCQK
jgi:hypothetical protein